MQVQQVEVQVVPKQQPQQEMQKQSRAAIQCRRKLYKQRKQQRELKN